MVTTKQTYKIDTHAKTKESICNVKDRHEITRDEGNRKIKEQKRATKTFPKQLTK